MAKFEEDKIITALHPEKAEVGKKYWVSDELVDLKEGVEKEKTSYKLKKVRKDCLYPFITDCADFQFLYPYEEPPKKRMTNIQLMEWLSKGKGLYKNKKTGCCNVNFTLFEDGKDNEVRDEFCIHTWDSEEWIEPTVDIYERDCRGGE